MRGKRVKVSRRRSGEGRGLRKSEEVWRGKYSYKVSHVLTGWSSREELGA